MYRYKMKQIYNLETYLFLVLPSLVKTFSRLYPQTKQSRVASKIISSLFNGLKSFLMQITTVILMMLKGHFFDWEQIPNQLPLHIQTKRLKNSLISHQQEVAIEYSQLQAILACNRDTISVNRTNRKIYILTNEPSIHFYSCKNTVNLQFTSQFYFDKLLKDFPEHIYLFACIILLLQSVIY